MYQPPPVTTQYPQQMPQEYPQQIPQSMQQGYNSGMTTEGEANTYDSQYLQPERMQHGATYHSGMAPPSSSQYRPSIRIQSPVSESIQPPPMARPRPTHIESMSGSRPYAPPDPPTSNLISRNSNVSPREGESRKSYGSLINDNSNPTCCTGGAIKSCCLHWVFSCIVCTNGCLRLCGSGVSFKKLLNF